MNIRFHCTHCTVTGTECNGTASKRAGNGTDCEAGASKRMGKSSATMGHRSICPQCSPSKTPLPQNQQVVDTAWAERYALTFSVQPRNAAPLAPGIRCTPSFPTSEQRRVCDERGSAARHQTPSALSGRRAPAQRIFLNQSASLSTVERCWKWGYAPQSGAYPHFQHTHYHTNCGFKLHVLSFKFQASFKFQISSFKFQVPSFRFRLLQVSSFKFQVFMFHVSCFKFQVSSFMFQVSSFKFQVSSFMLQVSSFKFQTWQRAKFDEKN